MTEADELARIQQRLERKRAAVRAELPRERKTQAIGVIQRVANADTSRLIIPPLCPCGAKLYGAEVEAGKCSSCAGGGLRGERVRVALERIPALFRGHRLDRPIEEDGRLVVPEAARVRAAEWLASGRKVLTIGGSKSGSGKTTLAGATAASAIEQDAPIVWIHAGELRADYHDEAIPKRHLETIRRARGLVVIDGLGKELGNADPSSGLAKMRLPIVQEAIGLIHVHESARFVLTIDIPGDALKAAYGDDTSRRIASPRNATVISLARDGKLELETF